MQMLQIQERKEVMPKAKVLIMNYDDTLKRLDAAKIVSLVTDCGTVAAVARYGVNKSTLKKALKGEKNEKVTRTSRVSCYGSRHSLCTE